MPITKERAVEIANILGLNADFFMQNHIFDHELLIDNNNYKNHIIE